MVKYVVINAFFSNKLMHSPVSPIARYLNDRQVKMIKVKETNRSVAQLNYTIVLNVNLMLNCH